MLSRGEADLSAAPLSIIPARAKVIDFPFPLRLGKVGLTMSIGALKPWNFLAYTDILRWDSWVALACVIVTVAVVNNVVCPEQCAVNSLFEVSLTVVWK